MVRTPEQDEIKTLKDECYEEYNLGLNGCPCYGDCPTGCPCDNAYCACEDQKINQDNYHDCHHDAMEERLNCDDNCPAFDDQCRVECFQDYHRQSIVWYRFV